MDNNAEISMFIEDLIKSSETSHENSLDDLGLVKDSLTNLTQSFDVGTHCRNWVSETKVGYKTGHKFNKYVAFLRVRSVRQNS